MMKIVLAKKISRFTHAQTCNFCRGNLKKKNILELMRSATSGDQGDGEHGVDSVESPSDIDSDTIYDLVRPLLSEETQRT